MSEFNNDYGTKPKAKRHGWKIAVAIASVLVAGALVVTAFAAGALLMRYAPDGAIKNLLEGKTATPVSTSAAQQVNANAPATPSPAMPQIGGNNTLALTSGVDIPAIVAADGPAVVGVLNKVKGQYGFGNQQSGGSDQTQGSGSGVIFSTDGYIVTNNHVVAGADSLSVVLPGGQEVPAKLIGTDAQTDLAVLKIDKTGLTAMPFGNSDNVQVGETVLAIGNPLGTELSGTVTAGIISAKNRELTVDGYNYKLLQTDAAINPGNSGGALINMKGELIGINQLKSTSAGADDYGNAISAEGIGFAIPINSAKPIIEQLIRDGGIDRPVLGISTNPVTQAQADYNRVPVGVMIVSISDGSPAMKAGLQAGDIITEFDGAKVTGLTDVRNGLNKHKVGDTVKVKVYRTSDSKEYTLDVTLGSSLEMNK